MTTQLSSAKILGNDQTARKPCREPMDFRNSNTLNVLLNAHCGNFLPMTADRKGISIARWTYNAFTLSIEALYLCASIAGIFHVSKIKALQDSTVNIIVNVEVILLSVHMHSNRDSLLRLIESFNRLLGQRNEAREKITEDTIRQTDRFLRIYSIGAISSVIIWSAIPIGDVFQNNQFSYADYRVPALIGAEPLSKTEFVCGVLLEVIGAGYTISKKIGFDYYMIHMVLLLTAQYRCLSVELTTIFREVPRNVTGKILIDTGVSMKATNEKMNAFARQYGAVIRISGALKRLLSLNVAITYVNNVFRFCFLGYMIVTVILLICRNSELLSNSNKLRQNPSMEFGKWLTALYTVGSLVEVYIICFCVQRLLESSISVADNAFHEKWYICDAALLKYFARVVFANKIECKLSAWSVFDLTLPSFMLILNQAYTTCLLFLKVQ